MWDMDPRSANLQAGGPPKDYYQGLGRKRCRPGWAAAVEWKGKDSCAKSAMG